MAATRVLSDEEQSLVSAKAQVAAAQISSRYVSPETGGWSDIGDPLILRYLLEGFALGLKPHDACQAAGISTDTYARWMKRAELDPDSPHAALAEALKSAKAQGKRWHLQNIQRHSFDEWTASAWTLERTDPEQFALRKDNSDGPKVVVQIGIDARDVQVSISTGTTLAEPTLSPLPALTQGEGV